MSKNEQQADALESARVAQGRERKARFPSSESIVLEGIDGLESELRGAGARKIPEPAESGEGPVAGEDPLRPVRRTPRAEGAAVFQPAASEEIRPKRRKAPPPQPETSGPGRTEREAGVSVGAAVGKPGEAEVRRPVAAKLPPRRDPTEPPRQFAEPGLEEVPVRPVGVSGRASSPAGGDAVERRPVVAAAPLGEGAFEEGPVVEPGDLAGPLVRERLGIQPGRKANRKAFSPAVLVAFTVLVQTGITLLLGVGAWKLFGAPWVEKRVMAQSGAVAETAAGAAASVPAGPAPGSAATGVLREEAFLVLSALADQALVTGERLFLEEFHQTYTDEAMDRLVYRFAEAREGLVLAAFRDRPARYRLQVEALFPGTQKTREAQLSPAELVQVLQDSGRSRTERARAAYLLRSTRDYSVVDAVAEVMRTDRDLEVAVNALYAFLTITGCEEVTGFDVDGLLEWWGENRTDLLARTSAPGSGE